MGVAAAAAAVVAASLELEAEPEPETQGLQVPALPQPARQTGVRNKSKERTVSQHRRQLRLAASLVYCAHGYRRFFITSVSELHKNRMLAIADAWSVIVKCCFGVLHLHADLLGGYAKGLPLDASSGLDEGLTRCPIFRVQKALMVETSKEGSQVVTGPDDITHYDLRDQCLRTRGSASRDATSTSCHRLGL